MRQNSLFPLTLRPTTRDIADSVKEGGVANLPDAMRKADAATYQEVRCRSALNRVKGMPFEWTLNPYRGCTHGCHYCFARRYHTQFELDADDSFASVILVKVNFVEVLSKELSRERWDRDTSVALGTATDPYQPIEGSTSSRAGRSSNWARRRRRSGSSRKARWSCATPTCCSRLADQPV